METVSGFMQSWSLDITSMSYGLLILLVSICVYWYGFARFQYFHRLGIPGPKPYPFIGNLPDLVKAEFQLHLLFDQCIKKYGKVFGIHLMGNPALVISDVEILKEILVREFPKFHDRKFFQGIPKPYDMMMSVAIGERWRYLRNTLNPTFSAPKVRKMTDMIDEALSDVMQKINVANQFKKPLEICELVQHYSMRSILASSFGLEATDSGVSYSKITEYARNALREPKWINLIFMLPFGDTILKHIPWAFATRYEPIANLTKRIIANRRKSQGDHKDLLQLMLEAQKTPDNQGRTMTDDEILAQCIIYLIAGYETTSTVLILAFHLLAINPDKQQQLRKEIDEIWKEADVQPSYDEYMSLPYLDMVINEVLRLYPPAYNLLRYCNQDCSVKGIKIPNGVHVFVPTYSLHRDATQWKNPDQFIPERFRPDQMSHDKYAFCPFGHGPRNCIGQRFAFLEIKLALLRILKKYRVQRLPETPKEPKIVARTTLTIMEPIFVRFVEI